MEDLDKYQRFEKRHDIKVGEFKLKAKSEDGKTVWVAPGGEIIRNKRDAARVATFYAVMMRK